MITDWQTNKIYFSKRLISALPKLNNDLNEALAKCGIEPIYLDKTNDIWARDYMPVQVSENKFIEYRYDPDYLQGKEKDKRDIKTYPDLVCKAHGIETEKTDIIIDGGNVIKSENAVIMTDKILKENEFHYSKSELSKELKRLFEVEELVFIPWDSEYDRYGHSDGMVRFINNEEVLINGFYDHYTSLFKKKLFQALNNFKITKLEFGFINFETQWAYMNFLQTQDLILLPSGINKNDDKTALQQFQKIFPEYADKGRIFQIDVSKLIDGDGALNCVSWTIKE